MVDVMVQLAPEAASVVRAGGDLPADLHAAEERLRPLELAFEPLHYGAQDRALESWFRIHVEDERTAALVASALSESPAVESAYVEPPSGPPG